MASFRSKVKSYIGKLIRSNRNEENVEIGVVRSPPGGADEAREAHDDHNGEDFLRTSSPSIPASERLDRIGSWPVWKRKLDTQQTESGIPTRSWVLQRIPDSTPFMSLMKTEDLLAALEQSYENCIFEGPYRSEHPGSVLYCTVLNRIAEFGCCPLCKSVAQTVRSEFPVRALSLSFEVVVWCADWGILETDEAKVAIVAKTFQNDGVFLTRG